MNDQLDLNEIFKAAGGKAELARKLGIDKSAVSQWRRVPAGRCRQVSALLGIPLHRLRPDYWDAPEDKK